MTKHWMDQDQNPYQNTPYHKNVKCKYCKCTVFEFEAHKELFGWICRECWRDRNMKPEYREQQKREW